MFTRAEFIILTLFIACSLAVFLYLGPFFRRADSISLALFAPWYLLLFYLLFFHAPWFDIFGILLGGFVRRKCIVLRCAPTGVEHTRTAFGRLFALLSKTIVLHNSGSHHKELEGRGVCSSAAVNLPVMLSEFNDMFHI